MGFAKVRDDFLSGDKRRALEIYLRDSGHKWPADPKRGPMSAAECIINIWLHFGPKEDLPGTISDASAEAWEAFAKWPGKPGLLFDALLATGWIKHAREEDCEGWSWPSEEVS